MFPRVVYGLAPSLRNRIAGSRVVFSTSPFTPNTFDFKEGQQQVGRPLRRSVVLRVRGRLSPPRSRARVRIFSIGPDTNRRVLLATVPTTRSGTFALRSHVPRRRGTYGLYAAYGGSRTSSSAVSCARMFRAF